MMFSNAVVVCLLSNDTRDGHNACCATVQYIDVVKVAAVVMVVILVTKVSQASLIRKEKARLTVGYMSGGPKTDR
jgi:hypothetical protein